MHIPCARRYCCLFAGAALLLSPATRAAAQSPAIEKIPILLDTDAGTDVDDAFALALILASPELELRGITTSGSDPQTRALHRQGHAHRCAEGSDARQMGGDDRQIWCQETFGPPYGGDRVDEIQFLLPTGAELIVDDVLLFEPGP
jgi:hypothetical protein